MDLRVPTKAERKTPPAAIVAPKQPERVSSEYVYTLLSLFNCFIRLLQIDYVKATCNFLIRFCRTDSREEDEALVHRRHR